MEVFALGLKLKEEGASTVKASVDKMRAAMAGATQSAKGLDTGVGALSGAFTKLAAVVGVGVLGQSQASVRLIGAASIQSRRCSRPRQSSQSQARRTVGGVTTR